jgi:hypothetical protein
MQWSVVTWRGASQSAAIRSSFGASPNREFTVRWHVRQSLPQALPEASHRASARHTNYQGFQEFVSEVNVGNLCVELSPGDEICLRGHVT